MAMCMKLFFLVLWCRFNFCRFDSAFFDHSVYYDSPVNMQSFFFFFFFYWVSHCTAVMGYCLVALALMLCTLQCSSWQWNIFSVYTY